MNKTPRLRQKRAKKQLPYYKSVGGKSIYFDKTEFENWLLHQRFRSESEIDEIEDNYMMNKKR